MKKRRLFSFAVALLALTASLSLAFLPQPAWADAEDAAIFYEELTKYGNWYEDDAFGPAWYPTQDPNQTPPKPYDADFRPYVDGRWTPTDQGFIFETVEPWGWATYHYGNWTLNNQGRWVWCPGRTWYPNTVVFKTSDEYAGWAPLPPPRVRKAVVVRPPEPAEEEIPLAPPPPPPAPVAGPAPVPMPAPAPPPPPPPPMEPVVDYMPGPVYPPEMTPAFLPPPAPGLPPPPPPAPEPCIPCWTFVSAPAMMPGFGQPYTPDFSYAQSEAALIPPDFAPVAFAETAPVMNFASVEPFVAPLLVGLGAAAVATAVVGTYNWGPPPSYISQVTNINQTQVNQTINNNTTNITNIKNVSAPTTIIDKSKNIIGVSA